MECYTSELTNIMII